ncbi:MAG TPA: hypothetical protein VLI04_02710 [Nocardioidaceae bacterium]|nr:hypothetical protein [Nocardioidaceae bacterium]
MVRVVVAVAAFVLLAGCTDEPSVEPAPPTPTTPTAPEAIVEFVVLGSGDVPRTTASLIEDGDQVEGQVTLDECGFAFTSEADRVARRQVSIVRRGDSGRYSHEVVVYGSEAEARHALAEWRAAVRDCPADEFIKPDSPGLVPLRTEVLEFHPIESLPIRNNTVVRERVSTKRGRAAYLAAIYQQHGVVLSVSYLATTAEPSTEQVNRLTTLALEAAERMVTLPGGDLA